MEQVIKISAFLVIVAMTTYINGLGWDNIRDAFQSTGNAIADTAKKGYEGIKDIGGKAEEGIKGAAGTVAEQTKKGYETVKSGFESFGKEVQQMANRASDIIKSTANQTGDFFKKTIYEKGLRDTIYQRGLKEGLYEKGLKGVGEETTKFMIDTVYKKGLLTVAGGTILIGKIAAQSFRKTFYSKMKPDFCTNVPDALHHLKPVDNPAVVSEDTEKLIPYIQQYSPIMYLHKDEVYYPIWATEWCTGTQTALKSDKGQFVVAKGRVTMDMLYELYRESKLPQFTEDKKKLEEEKAQNPAAGRLKEINDRLAFIDRVIDWKYTGKPIPANIDAKHLYFDNPMCATFGSNPAQNKDTQGDLTTPVYVVTYEADNKLYFQYLYLYGFNGPYDIGPISGDRFDIQNAHECDLEHITLELDKNSKNILRIYYGSHGRKEGFWLHANQAPFEGTHPVAYVALGGHGNYPREGTYVRIYGIANDITGKHIRWTPKLIRLYGVDDPRFDPHEMGWVVFPGNMGKRGVGNPAGQDWYMNTPTGLPGRDYGDVGRSYPEADAPFCKNPSWTNKDPFTGTATQIAAEAEYAACITANVHKAVPPE